MFKVGDKVKRARKFAQLPPEWPDFEEGKVYTVTEVTRSGNWIALESMPCSVMPPYNANYFELVQYTVPGGFKVGDKVVCNEDIGILKAGKVYTVREPYKEDIKTDPAGKFVYVDGDLRVFGGYYPERFKLHKPELTEAQSAGVAGGLQEHSVGDSYPLSAVMYEHKGERCFTVENLQTGEIVGAGSSVSNFHSFERAYEEIEIIKRGYSRPLWTTGRVVYLHGGWAVVTIANPVRVTRLHNMLHHPNTKP